MIYADGEPAHGGQRINWPSWQEMLDQHPAPVVAEHVTYRHCMKDDEDCAPATSVPNLAVSWQIMTVLPRVGEKGGKSFSEIHEAISFMYPANKEPHRDTIRRALTELMTHGRVIRPVSTYGPNVKCWRAA